MSTLSVTITPKPRSHRRTILIEVDADKFERLAAEFGMFNPEFLESLDRAERDVEEGKTRTINSLDELLTDDTRKS